MQRFKDKQDGGAVNHGVKAQREQCHYFNQSPVITNDSEHNYNMISYNMII